MKRVLPVLIESYAKTLENEKRASLLTLITQFGKISKISDEKQTESGSLIRDWKDKLIEIYNATLVDPLSTLDLQSAAISGLADLMTSPVLPQTEV